MSVSPALNPQVIGQTERALGAVMTPLLARSGTSFEQWLVLTITMSGGGALGRDQLTARIAGARKIDKSTVLTAIDELADAGLLAARGPAEPSAEDRSAVELTDAGRARYQQIRSAVDEVTGRLFGGFPADDLATAARILATVTDRANAELANA
jgi:DNA-binding MarR family transcriptional regulator